MHLHVLYYNVCMCKHACMSTFFTAGLSLSAQFVIPYSRNVIWKKMVSLRGRYERKRKSKQERTVQRNMLLSSSEQLLVTGCEVE